LAIPPASCAMRLLFISQDFPPAMGGIQTYTAELAPRLATRCERFLLIAPSHPESRAFDAALNYEVQRLPIQPDLLVLRAVPHVMRTRPASDSTWRFTSSGPRRFLPSRRSS